MKFPIALLGLAAINAAAFADPIANQPPFDSLQKRGHFGPDKRVEYITQCVEQAENDGLDVEKAELDCKCSAEVLEEYFTSDQIVKLASGNGAEPEWVNAADFIIRATCET